MTLNVVSREIDENCLEKKDLKIKFFSTCVIQQHASALLIVSLLLC